MSADVSPGRRGAQKARKRRPRDPAATREIILEAARTRLAQDGPEGLSLVDVANLAGVNRGTAYQHFETREKLINATADWVSDKLFRAVFGDPETIGERDIERADIPGLTDRLTTFAMANPELCRVWLLQVLSSAQPALDPFWREYQGSIERFANTELAEANVDSEALSVIMLSGSFFWPIWAHAQAKTPEETRALARRFANECLRLSMYGSLKSASFPEVAKRLKSAPKIKRGVAKAGGGA